MTEKNNDRLAVVLGSSGFIGGHLSSKLLADGWRVIGVDIRSNPILTSHSNFFEKKIDFVMEKNWLRVFEDAVIIFHCICTTTSSTSNISILRDAKENLISSLRILESLKNYRGKFVFFSSGGAIYGNASQVPTPENYSGEKLSSYAIVKQTIEDYLALCHHINDLDYVVLRLTNPYGPSQMSKQGFGLIPTILEKITLRQPITVFGNGSQLRDYIFIDDLVLIATTISTRASLKYRVMNLGSGSRATVMHIIKTLESLLGIKSEIEYNDKRKGDVESVVLDTSKLIESIGDYPFTKIERGLKIVASQHQRNYKICA